jgi:hypothetical protein
MAGKPEVHRETITIGRRWSWLTALSIEITCDPATPPSVKRGLAVKGAYEADAVLAGADLTGADLRDADLTGADLAGAALAGAALAGAALADAVLAGADLTGADLRDADLTGADLRDADLRGAVLRGAALAGAVLAGADLTGADLRDADLRGEKIERIFALAGRLDGYTFYGVQLRTGAIKIAAGCRWFALDEFRTHVAEDYPGTEKARETLDIIDFIERRAVGLPAPAAEVAAEEAA